MYNPKSEELHELEDLLRDKSIRVIGVVADRNQGKSNLLYNVINITKKHASNTQIVGFKLSVYVPGVLMINSLIELSTITNSLIILDEWADLVDIYNRKESKGFEKVLRTIYHPYRNNTIILCGLARNFNGRISGELEAIVFKQTTLIDVIQRSMIDNVLKGFSSEGKAIRNDYMLVMPIDTALIYHPRKIKRWHVVDVPYLKDYDVKLNNQPVIKWDDDSKLNKKLDALTK